MPLQDYSEIHAHSMGGASLGLTWEFDFGKYRGYTIEQVIDNDPQYVDWCQQTVVGFILSKDARTELDLTLAIEDDPLADASFLDD